MSSSDKLRWIFVLVIFFSLHIFLVQFFTQCELSSHVGVKSYFARDFSLRDESQTVTTSSLANKRRTANDDAKRRVVMNDDSSVKNDVYSIYGKAVSLQDWKTAKTQWRPENGKLNTLYGYLNVSKEDAPRHLPLTLDPDYPYLLHNPRLCGHDVIDVLVMLHIRPDNFGRRTDVRSVMCQQTDLHPFVARCLFLLGSVEDPALQDRLNQEHKMYGDLVQGRFVDDYHNLTLKGVMAYNWVTHHCPHVRYVLKLDDDVFVDMFKLLFSFLPSFRGHQRSIVCNLWQNSSMRISRDSRWAVDDALFHNLKVYPYTYCSGFGVLFTGDLIPQLYAAAFFAPVFWIDDVYLFGILPALAGNVTFFHNGPIPLVSDDFLGCMEKRGTNCSMVLGTVVNTKAFRAMLNLTYRLRMLPAASMVSTHVD